MYLRRYDTMANSCDAEKIIKTLAVADSLSSPKFSVHNNFNFDQQTAAELEIYFKLRSGTWISLLKNIITT